MSSTRSRTAVLFAALAITTAACGARLTADQRTAGIGALGQGGGAAGDTNNPQAAGGKIPIGSGLPSGGPGSSIGGGGIGAPAPPGGNGGATDVGVTGNQITIASVADVSGVQPGLFKSAWQATAALTAYVNTNGGIYGRALKLMQLDSKADSVANKAAVQEACDKAFAMVGSMSAFDDGGAQTGQDCGIPDVSAITVNPSRSRATNVYPAYPVSPDYYAVGKSNWIKQTYGDAVIKHAAFIKLNAGVSRANGQQRIDALTKIGFNFVYTAEVQVVEANYSAYVREMQKRGVEYIGMLADYQSIVRLQKAMKQQGWFPKVRDFDSVTYSANYLTQGQDAVNGAFVFLNTALFSEDKSNPEMQLYEQWLGRVYGGTAKPDYFGMYAWSAGRLFVKAATEAGARLTRKGVLAALRAIHSWNDYGMHAAHDIGAKRESPCFLYLEVKNGAFVRKYPASGWDCNRGGLIAAHG
jgi:ABC-type branched-subunit amino acid transport system substrate-binding protein